MSLQKLNDMFLLEILSFEVHSYQAVTDAGVLFLQHPLARGSGAVALRSIEH